MQKYRRYAAWFAFLLVTRADARAYYNRAATRLQPMPVFIEIQHDYRPYYLTLNT